MAARAERLQRQLRRHDLLRLRARRRRRRAHRRREVGEVPARARARPAAAAARRRRPLLRLGRPRVRQRLLRRGARRRDLRRRGRAPSSTTRPRRTGRRRGLYRTFRWGRNLELFFLDGRSFRSAKATAACGGDIAPTAPPAVRQAFAALAPGARTSGAAGMSRRDRLARADAARRAQLDAFTQGDPRLDRDLQGRRQPGAADAALRAPVRPLGGLRGRSHACARRPPGRPERRRAHDRHPRAPDRRGADADVRRRAARSGRASGR